MAIWQHNLFICPSRNDLRNLYVWKESLPNVNILFILLYGYYNPALYIIVVKVITWTLDKNKGSDQVNQKESLNAFFE